MYTAEIGKLIFSRWKERTGREVTVKTYFNEEFFPLFFDSERYLMWVNNSRFDQAYKQKKKRPLTTEVRQAALSAFHEDVEVLEGREGHLFMGGFSRDLSSATASQISQIDIGFHTDDAYYSWLGMAAGIGVKGGVSLLLKTPAVLDLIVAGWSYYRKFLNDYDTLAPHQIDSWNAWWLIHNASRKVEKDRLAGFPPPNAMNEKDGVSAFVTPSWISVLFALIRVAEKPDIMTYIYSFGQTNKSIGFVPIKLGEIQKLSTLYEKLFGAEDFTRERKSLEALYDTELSFFQACRMGAIGLRAVEPKDLRKYMTTRDQSPKSIKFSENTIINFRIYQTWIIAMLKNEELLLTAQELAEVLSKVGPSSRGKKVLSQAVAKVLEAGGKKQFITALTDLITEEEFKQSPAAEQKGVFEKTVHELMRMPATNVPLFITLVRFKHAYNKL
ncbi:MAG: hypothetical protein ACE362_11040 [Phaeodactylibacter xiamenensis]|uniref:Uncharacterized protein n=1 Tax=Phaeodactylibacter xiamenensis TaxID=1524460 RepID=A0A098S562_9BACT|nr:hypothetical protein [Phaeodactylibacter xiamenensis]KGE86938.1 hypothetical protein IX84_17990 [Phaeodactylibacter xiamenensis]MCR9050537.1 hypothetical protein [bacterium]